ncbi:hypothetical protein NONO_c58240 [Nocardia nova SH22a]|uniref:DUF397 domain-containing protein n=1 Tax=Nocardia nova SH22a TaxID=1415166 RepID=W5TTS7_9NOCA|nr:DUF397 domain-containing protein [Nocardia nova]AHH20601.1 hypothetical protein NONO_c58240 [Nocardia nova SH22a]
MRSKWFKSSFSGSEHTCVEVRFAGDLVLVRDSKYLRDASNDPAAQPVIEVAAELWQVFLDLATGVEQGVFDGVPSVEVKGDGRVVLRAEDGTVLAYTSGEWDAFIAGIRSAEFCLVA